MPTQHLTRGRIKKSIARAPAHFSSSHSSHQALPALGCGSAANAHNTIQTSESARRLHPEMRHSSKASDMLMSYQDPPLSHSLCVESSPLGTEKYQVS